MASRSHRIFSGLSRAGLATGHLVAVADDVVGDAVGWLELALRHRTYKSAHLCRSCLQFQSVSNCPAAACYRICYRARKRQTEKSQIFFC